MKINRKKFVIRLAASPFVLGLLVVTYTWTMIRHWVGYIRFGGEFVTYKHKDPETITDIFNELKKQTQIKK